MWGDQFLKVCVYAVNDKTINIIVCVYVWIEYSKGVNPGEKVGNTGMIGAERMCYHA